MDVLFHSDIPIVDQSEDIVKDELNVKKIEFGGVELESGTVIAIQDIIQIDV